MNLYPNLRTCLHSTDPLPQKLDYILSLDAKSVMAQATKKLSVISLKSLRQRSTQLTVSDQHGCVDCQQAGLGVHLYVESQGMLLCPNCSSTYFFYGEPRDNLHEPDTQNLKIQHFQTRLELLEGKVIPKGSEVHNIIAICNRSPRTRRAAETPLGLYLWMKDKGFSKFYDYIPYIRQQLGFPVCKFSPDEREVLIQEFTLLVHRWYTVVGETNNLLIYNYLIYKLCQQQGYVHHLPNIGIYRMTDKITEYETLWKRYCKHTDTPYVPF